MVFLVIMHLWDGWNIGEGSAHTHVHAGRPPEPPPQRHCIASSLNLRRGVHSFPREFSGKLKFPMCVYYVSLFGDQFLIRFRPTRIKTVFALTRTFFVPVCLLHLIDKKQGVCRCEFTKAGLEI